MAQATEHTYIDLQNKCRQFQEILDKQNKSLRHWQLWEAEYEGLKEEILSGTAAPSREDLITKCNQYNGELLNKSEINEILGTNITRDVEQVINLLDRRIEYVQRNITTIQKQIHITEQKLDATSIIGSPEMMSEECLPLTDITETLDDQGNIISSQLFTPGSFKPKLLEVLQKAGTDTTSKIAEESQIPSSDKSRRCIQETGEDTSSRKCVTFADDKLLDPKLGTAKIVNGVKDPQNSSTGHSVVPSDESAEDAFLRREMLEYGMLEVGSVVAELEIESESDFSDDYLDEKYSSTSDEEDSFGRSTGRVVTDDCRKHMTEIQKRIGDRKVKDVFHNDCNVNNVEEGIGRITIQKEERQETISKKKVRFSKDLDVSPNKVSIPLATYETDGIRTPRPISDESIAQQNGDLEVKDQFLQARNLQFKNPMIAAEKTGSISNRSLSMVPERQNGTPLSEIVIERETSSHYPVVKPDEINTRLLRQEVAAEYYKMRNVMIQRQGGFMKENESVRVEFTEEEGGPKKMSKFKAARLARS